MTRVSGRFVAVGVAAALLVGAAGAIVASCYDVPEPDCGFICGPSEACPNDYTCADDHYCHRVGALPGLVCAPPDAPRSVTDAAADAAALDAMPDAAADAMPDAAVDADLDAAIDAP